MHFTVNCYLTLKWFPATISPLITMPSKRILPPETGALNLRDIPKDLLYKLKMAAAAEHRTVKGFILALVEQRIHEMEKKGLLPKGKG